MNNMIQYPSWHHTEIVYMSLNYACIVLPSNSERKLKEREQDHVKSNKSEKDTTYVLDKFEDIIACALDLLSKVQASHDMCLDQLASSIVLGTDALKNAFTSIQR